MRYYLRPKSISLLGKLVSSDMNEERAILTTEIRSRM
jgi:hypothetical protein